MTREEAEEYAKKMSYRTAIQAALITKIKDERILLLTNTH